MAEVPKPPVEPVEPKPVVSPSVSRAAGLQEQAKYAKKIGAPDAGVLQDAADQEANAAENALTGKNKP